LIRLYRDEERVEGEREGESSDHGVESEIDDAALQALGVVGVGRGAGRANAAPRGGGVGEVAEHDEPLAGVRLEDVDEVAVAGALELVLEVRGRVDVGRRAHLGAHLGEERVRHGGHGLPELLLRELPDGDAGDRGREPVLPKPYQQQTPVGLHQERRQHVGQVRAALPDPLQRRVLREHQVRRQRHSQRPPPRSLGVVRHECVILCQSKPSLVRHHSLLSSPLLCSKKQTKYLKEENVEFCNDLNT
jgi:hypothetical protein